MLGLQIKLGLLFFYALISIGVAFSIFMTASTVSSVFLLILIYLTAVGGLFLLGSEFLAFTILIVYVGAVSILFIFVVMLLGPGIEKQQNFQEQKEVSFFWRSLHKIVIGVPFIVIVKQIAGILIFLFSDLKNKVTVVSSYPYPKEKDMDIEIYSNDILIISKNLYIEHSPLFYLIGLILLVAMVGSIILCTNSFTKKK